MIDVDESFSPALRKLCFHFLECDMIMVTVFLSMLNQMEFNLVQNRKENCHHDHIPFNVKGNGNIVFSVYEYTHRGNCGTEPTRLNWSLQS